MGYTYKKKCFLVKPCIVKPSVLVYVLFQVGEKKRIIIIPELQEYP